MKCPRCGATMTGGICNNCGFPMNRRRTTIAIAKFFDTVDHDKLMTIFGRMIKDGDVISVVRKFLVSGVMIDDEYEDTIVGTPQGGNISPLLANVMLNELDKELEARTTRRLLRS